jgi:hypothetical protein
MKNCQTVCATRERVKEARFSLRIVPIYSFFDFVSSGTSLILLLGSVNFVGAESNKLVSLANLLGLYVLPIIL